MVRLLGLLLAIVVPSAQAPLWEHKFPGNIVDVSAPVTAPCIGVLTTGGIAVFSDDGKPLWERRWRLG